MRPKRGEPGNRAESPETREMLEREIKQAEDFNNRFGFDKTSEINEINELKQKMSKSSFEDSKSSFETYSLGIIGLLSAVVAFIHLQRDSFSVCLIIVSVAVALMLYACLLHVLFQSQFKLPFWRYWLSFALVPAIAIVVVGVQAYANTVVQR